MVATREGYKKFLEEEGYKHNEVVLSDIDNDGEYGARIVGYHVCYSDDTLMFIVCDLGGNKGWNKSQTDEHDFIEEDVEDKELLHLLSIEEIV